MKVGLLARAEDRGIGIQTWGFYRHMRPDRTLVVDMGQLARGFPMHLDRYPDATVVPFDGVQLPEATVREWLAGLDVVFMVETPYDYRLLGWADELGVATVIQINPEFFRWGPAEPDLPRPTAWWAPTTWRLHDLPKGMRHVPVPTDPERWQGRQRDRAGTFLHMAGHRAMADRNGTTLMLQAVRHVREPMRVVFASQDRRLPSARGYGRHVKVESKLGGVADPATLYDDADVLVMPRRYGGLCLPVLEASAAGLVTVMPDASPQSHDWPHVQLVPADRGADFKTQAGPVALWNADPRALGATLDALAADPERVARLSAEALAWADANSWAVLRPLYLQELRRACDRR